MGFHIIEKVFQQAHKISPWKMISKKFMKSSFWKSAFQNSWDSISFEICWNISLKKCFPKSMRFHFLWKLFSKNQWDSLFEKKKKKTFSKNREIFQQENFIWKWFSKGFETLPLKNDFLKHMKFFLSKKCFLKPLWNLQFSRIIQKNFNLP